MRPLRFGYAFSIGITTALLVGCGMRGSYNAVMPSAVSKGPAFAPARSKVDPALHHYRVLYSFAGGSTDGDTPTARLIDVKGILYGTTSGGGGGASGCGGTGCGTVYSITTTGTEKMLHSFDRRPYVTVPLAGLVDVKGTLYGTTVGGAGLGSVYAISTTGKLKVLHIFVYNHGDGYSPEADLINVKGVLYSTTYFGGRVKCHTGEGCGIVYSISTAGGENILHNFLGGSDGENPQAGLLNVGGTLYGTTVIGGGSGCFGYGCGTVFSISTTGKERVLHSFGGATDGANPEAGLIDVNGTLYGTTFGGGKYYQGTVYSISTTGKEKVLYSFRAGADGSNPQARLIDVNGTLYGTTVNGGGCYPTSSCGCNEVSGTGCGTVFSISTTGSERVLHKFAGNPDGANPQASLINVKGTLYGTTANGGVGGSLCCGTVFALSP